MKIEDLPMGNAPTPLTAPGFPVGRNSMNTAAVTPVLVLKQATTIFTPSMISGKRYSIADIF